MSGDYAASSPQSNSSNQIRLITSLQDERSAREREGLFFVEGVRNFLSVLDGGWAVHTLFYSDRLLTSGIARSKVRQLKRAGVRSLQVAPEIFRSVSRAQRASGVGAIVRQRMDRLCTTSSTSVSSWLVLEHVHSPGNLGTLIRTSVGAGAGGVIAVGSSIDFFAPEVVRASMGTVFHQRIIRASIDELVEWISQRRLQVVGATPKSQLAYFDFRFQSPPVIVLGDERKGLSEMLCSVCNAFVRIPMAEGLDSLNVSVAGGLLMYEALRQGRAFPPK